MTDQERKEQDARWERIIARAKERKIGGKGYRTLSAQTLRLAPRS